MKQFSLPIKINILESHINVRDLIINQNTQKLILTLNSKLQPSELKITKHQFDLSFAALLDSNLQVEASDFKHQLNLNTNPKLKIRIKKDTNGYDISVQMKDFNVEADIQPFTESIKKFTAKVSSSNNLDSSYYLANKPSFDSLENPKIFDFDSQTKIQNLDLKNNTHNQIALASYFRTLRIQANSDQLTSLIAITSSGIDLLDSYQISNFIFKKNLDTDLTEGKIKVN